MKSTQKIILLFLFIFVHLGYSSNLIATEDKILHNSNIIQIQTTEDDMPTTEEMEPSPVEEDFNSEDTINPEENGIYGQENYDENEGNNDQYLDEDSY